MLKARFKPKRCPWCNSNLVAQIIHEIKSLTPAVEQDLDDRKAVLGVHLSEEANPEWQCMDCGAQIYDRDAIKHRDGHSAASAVVMASQNAGRARPRKKDH